MAGPSDFIRELRRRNVIRVVAAYAVAVWLIIQVVSIVLPTFHAPDWIMQALIVLIVLGFPVTIVLAWIFELTPTGIMREEDVDRAESITSQTGRKLDFIIIAALSVAVSFFVVDKFFWDGWANKEWPSGTEFTNSVAVLPFENMSGDESNSPFTTGVHDDLLTHLSKIATIKTISRTSVLQYRNTTKAIPEIAEDLGVANILEGGVQRSGDRVRINVQLIEASSDAHIWAETYDRQLTAVNVFEIQTEIAMAIAAALRATLSPIEERNIATVPTENLVAYEAYQLGIQALALRTTKSVGESIVLFTKATSIDPDFARAWAKLADSYVILAYYTGQEVEERHEMAYAAIDRALRLDVRTSEAHSALANLLEIEGDMPGALQAVKQALLLSPNDAIARFRYADILHETGHVQQSLLEWEKAAQLDPLSPLINDGYAWTLAEVGRFDEALARYQRVDEIESRYPGTAMSIGTIYGLAYGRLDLANLWYRKALSLDPQQPWLAAILGLVFLDLDDDETAEVWINRSLRMAPQHPWANGAMTMLSSYRVNPEQVRHFADETLSVDSRWRMGTALSHGRVSNLRDGNYDEILDRYELSFPELFSDDPDVNSVTYRPAIDIAGILLLTGIDERAADLLDKCQKQIAENIRVGYHGFWVSDVQILALQGKTDAALAALRQAIDQGWRTDWRYFFYVDPNLDAIRGEPEFQSMFKEIQDDMAAQLQRAREMDANGELAAIPEIAQ